jgi:L-iditol 2-dehydrogenase
LALDEIDLLGVRSSPNCYPATIALIASGAIKTEPLTTFTYGLDQIDEAFAALESRQVIRPIVVL